MGWMALVSAQSPHEIEGRSRDAISRRSCRRRCGGEGPKGRRERGKPFLTYLTFIIHAQEEEKREGALISRRSLSAVPLCSDLTPHSLSSDVKRGMNANVMMSRPLHFGPPPRRRRVYRQLASGACLDMMMMAWTPPPPLPLRRDRVTPPASGYFSGILATY